ncbi:MAG: endo-1,4-beta-xylanase xyn5A [Bacteroidaceae bacterium]|nr:endo-1,4-beta-xylanase xyn5A [Bacteroidaceae bacterium]
MKKLYVFLLLSVMFGASRAATITVTVDSVRHQTVTGFGAAACWGAMLPLDDVEVIKLLYGEDSPVGLNIVRMEISPNTKGDIKSPWDTPYDWHGYLPVIKEAKKRGAIVYGCPWSPPGEYKTNGTAQGGNSEEQGYQRGELHADYYAKFFPWLNSFLAYMHSNKADVDVVSLQNEPDWWVNYSGCLYSPEQLVDLVKNHAHLLKKSLYKVKLMSAESLNFNPKYTDPLLNDPSSCQHIDMIGGHLYGTPPLEYMAQSAATARKYGKDVWMTEHSVECGDRLPNWHDELIFAEEVNECMLAGANAYVYWYMLAHWSFVGTGEEKYGKGNEYGKLLRRGYVMSHFSKHLTGSTRLGSKASVHVGTNSAFQASAYIKDNSLIVMAIDTTKNAFDLKINLPYKVKGGMHLLSTDEAVCQQLPIELSGSTSSPVVSLPARSLNTYIFEIDREAEQVADVVVDAPEGPSVYYDLSGRLLSSPQGFCIERKADGSVIKHLCR